MKTFIFRKTFLATVATVGLALTAMTVVAQDSPTVTRSAPVELSYGASQIVQLAQAKISDDTIISYIHNSANSYALDADQIIYLRQQGVSDAVVNVMLNQPRNAPVANAPAAPAATQQNNSSDTGSAQTTVAASQPATSYVQSAPSSTVYVIPDTQTYYYNSSYYQPYYQPYYYGYPPVSLSFGFGGRWGGGWHGGGYHGGGGGFHGGGFHR
jgi:uncharacterized membrane protein YgcG